MALSKFDLAVTALAALALLGGCTSMERSYPGHTDQQVWKAMQVVAEDPEYKDWVVSENEVFVHEGERRIEVYRRLLREYWAPNSSPTRQEQEWRMTMQLLPDKAPPTVKITSRGPGLPAEASREADRYFDEIGKLLTAP